MDIFKIAERSMSMTEKSWQRHSNPWSVWTRFTCLPLISAAIWSREWLGWWSLILIGLTVFWAWYNPRAFPSPRHTDNWASKGTFGERIFLERRNTDIAYHHKKAAQFLAGLSAIGVPILFFGLWKLDFWAVVCGNLMTVFPKVWFVDRMVWIFEDHKNDAPKYKAWLKN